MKRTFTLPASLSTLMLPLPHSLKPLFLALFAAFVLPPAAWAKTQLVIDTTRPSASVSPTLYGLMTEEINHSYDGGLYAELVQNRAFLDDVANPLHWAVASSESAGATISLDPHQPVNAVLPVSLRLSATVASDEHPAGVANEGYWGIPVKASTVYQASFYAKAAANGPTSIRIALVSEDGATVFAQKDVPGLGANWQWYPVALATDATAPSTAHARLVLSVRQPGTLWLSLVSLFPPTYNNRPNGLRPDLMQMLVDLHPGFLRFPGGNYVEGNTVATRFDWKQTIGPVSTRPGHPSPWGYRSTDGLGLMEFLLWCTDMGAQPVLAVYAGYSLQGEYVSPGPKLQPFVQDALDEIEYVIGPTTSRWGHQRALDGHPEPFPLRYVEIGNEDWFDKSKSYDGRFAQFSDAIKQHYPQLECISTIGRDQPVKDRLKSRTPDILDEHYYQEVSAFLHDAPTKFYSYPRTGPKSFVGEWAAYETAQPPWKTKARANPPTPNMRAALADAAWMAGMERNSDFVMMQCYAPLLANVNGYQWRPNLIGYDALTSFGSPSYYAFRLFSTNVGDEILHCDFSGSPLQGSVTRSRQSGTIFLKIVNPTVESQSAEISLKAGPGLIATATVETLAADESATNSIDHPTAVVPTVSEMTHPAYPLIYGFPAHSITVIKLKPQ